jgi:Kef-type K+ transport system membrane component KefB
MRRFLVLAALLSLMLGLRLLQSESIEQQSALVLAAIGFVLLASFTVAEMGSALTLPRVTGYILTGALLAFFGILSPPVVLEMKMFNTLALGLIAISAGLELSLTQLKKVIGTLSATIVAKLLLVAPCVAISLYLYERYFGSLGLANLNEVTAVALVMGALAVGTSPSISLAIISETKSRGRLSDLVLGAAVLKDLVVVVVLAIAVALARGLASATNEASSSLLHVFFEIGYSIVAGGILGTLLILYIRYIRAEMLLFVAAMILVVAEVSRVFHLELLLVFIGGGLVVRNFSDYEHELMKPVELVSLPVFVVFFTIAGASIDLASTWQILPLAILICVVRAVAFYFSAKIGNAIGKEGDSVRDNAWLGYLPLAGVTLGLVGLASTQVPELMEPILSTGMAVVAINLLIGPITLRLALKRAGEIPGDAVESESNSDAEVQEGDPSPIERLPEPVRAHFYKLEHQLEHQLTERLRHSWGRWSKNTEQEFRELAHSIFRADERTPQLWQQLKPSKAELKSFSEECREAFLNARTAVRMLPEVLAVRLEDANRRRVDGDSALIVWKKRLAALKRVATFTRHPVRRIPVREIARLHFEPRLAEQVAATWNSRMRLIAALLEDFGEAIRGNVELRQLGEIDSPRILGSESACCASAWAAGEPC